MPSWFTYAVIGVIAAGILSGLLISHIIIKFRKRKSLTPAAAETVPSHNLSETKIPLKTALIPETRKASGKPAAIQELENNLAIATRPAGNELLSFQTTIWNTRRSEFNPVSRELISELTEAYVDMLLANNIVFLTGELGRDSQDLKANYLKISKKVADRLQKIIPAVTNSFN